MLYYHVTDRSHFHFSEPRFTSTTPYHGTMFFFFLVCLLYAPLFFLLFVCGTRRCVFFFYFLSLRAVLALNTHTLAHAVMLSLQSCLSGNFIVSSLLGSSLLWSSMCWKKTTLPFVSILPQTDRLWFYYNLFPTLTVQSLLSAVSSFSSFFFVVLLSNTFLCLFSLLKSVY